MNAHLFTSFNSTTSTGTVYTQNVDVTTATSIFSESSMDIRPVMLKYKRRTYIVGQFTRLRVYNEYGQIYAGGLNPPTLKPVLAAGTGTSTDVDQLAIGYLTFVHKVGTNVMQESNPGTPSDTFTAQGNGFTWSNLPITSLSDPRVTHIRGYRSMDGAIPKLAWERQIGVSTVVEAVPTGALGETLPVNPGLDGAADLDVYARGVPPYTQFAEQYHDSMYYAGSPVFPSRIYKSRLQEPESVNSVLSNDDSPSGYLETLDGEAVTGLKRWKDLLVVTCLRSAYAIQGFDAGDIQIIKISDFYGCVSNASLVRVGPEGDLFGAGQEGVWRFDGAFHDLMEESLRDYWKATYRANAANFQHDCFAAEDRTTNVYLVQTPKPSDAPAAVNSFKWVAHVEALQSGEAEPWWVFDQRARTDSVMGMLLAVDGSTFLEPHTGSCDGKVRKENVDTDDDDDGDAFQKALKLTGKHFFFDDQGGDHAHGRNYTDFDVFLRNQNTLLTVNAYAGDETASTAAAPQWTQNIPAAAVTSPRAKTARTSVHLGPVTEINGKGVAMEFTATAPVGVSLRGYSIFHNPGEQEQPFSS